MPSLSAHMDPDKMTGTPPAKVHLHHIGTEKVLNAQDLAKKGESHLYSIIHGEPHVFSFRIPFDDRRAALVEFHIKPIVCNVAQHTLYAVTGRYTPSHNDVQFSQALEVAQVVYDTYIAVSRLELNSDLYYIFSLPSKTFLTVADLSAVRRPPTLNQTIYRTLQRASLLPQAAQMIITHAPTKFLYPPKNGRSPDCPISLPSVY